LEGEQIERLKGEISEAMHARLRVRPEIEMVPEGTLERTAHKTKLIERRYQG
jgi:phenylacetate-coenzyme A ligase PaaK-like adenylate-forming protein